MEVTTNSTCATTVHAIRDTELACLPSGLLNTIKLKQPQVVSRLIQVLGERILGSYSRASTPLSSSLHCGMHTTGACLVTCSQLLLTLCLTLGAPDVKKHMVSNLSTVAVVPITRDVPLEPFTKHLCAALNTIGRHRYDLTCHYQNISASSLRLTSQLVEKELGIMALER